MVVEVLRDRSFMTKSLCFVLVTDTLTLTWHVNTRENIGTTTKILFRTYESEGFPHLYDLKEVGNLLVLIYFIRGHKGNTLYTKYEVKDFTDCYVLTQTY